MMRILYPIAGGTSILLGALLLLTRFSRHRFPGILPLSILTICDGVCFFLLTFSIGLDPIWSFETTRILLVIFRSVILVCTLVAILRVLKSLIRVGGTHARKD